jgi:acyl-coenzyme A thioesterase PaaI-like protein
VPALDAAFVREVARDGDRLVPRPFTCGGWSDTMLDGRYLSGLVAWGAEQLQGDPDLQPARLTVDMFRPGIVAPLEVGSRVVREGRRIKVVDVSVRHDGTEICRGTTVFLRRTADPRGDSWHPEERAAADPETLPPPDRRVDDGSRELGWEIRGMSSWDEIDRPRHIWVRETRAFVEGEIPSPFLRAALAADMCNGQTNGGTAGLAYINADLTMTLARLPVDEWVRLEGRSRAAADGVAAGAVDLYDRNGRIGQASLVGLADERNIT